MWTSNLRLLIASVSLLYATWCDVKVREVPDKVWILSIPLCLALSVADVVNGEISPVVLAISLVAGFPLGASLCYLGLYGGADMKALWLISAAYPSYPRSVSIPALTLFPAPVLLVFFLATLFSSLTPLSVLVVNLIDRFRGLDLLEGVEEPSRLRRALSYAVTRKVKLESLRGSLKYFPAERVVVEDGVAKRRLQLFVHAEADIEELVNQLEEHKDLFEGGVLASPTVPMLVFLTAGYVAASLILLI